MAARRDSQATRNRLLRAAFREFHQYGYRGADLDRILRQAGVTKGALYHHFRGKKALGYAVVEEVLQDWILDRWLKPLEHQPDLLAALTGLARWGEGVATPMGLSLGCPLQTLSQELSGTDEGFRQRLAAIYEVWRASLVELLVEAQGRGVVRSDLDARSAASFIIAAWEGSIGLAKSYQTSETLKLCRLGLEGYLETLKPPSQ